MKSLIDCTKFTCKTLNFHEVEYLIIGGTAVAIYGYPRLSTASNGEKLGKHDIDCWYNPTYNNYFKLLKALKNIGLGDAYIDEKEPEPNKSFFKYDSNDYKLDFLPHIKGLDKFNDSYKKRNVIIFEGVELSIISYRDLIITKKISNREKDRIDIEMLRKKNDEIFF